MRILVLSLLRIGDLVTVTPVLQGLRDRYPGARIDLAYNSQFRSLIPLLPHVDSAIALDRDGLQAALLSPDRPLFEAHDRLGRWLAAVNEPGCDVVLNLTHNRLSGWLCSLLPAHVHRGLHRGSDGRVAFGSAWFEHLNRWGLEPDGGHCHLTELYCRGAGLDGPVPSYSLLETPAGRREADALQGPAGRFVLVQPFTSEEKKNWGTARFAACVRTFRSMNPAVPVLLLGAPAERSVLQPLCDAIGDPGVRLAICTLAGAFTLARRAALLLTCDTSIKHIASAAGTPIIELGLGSSHFRALGAFVDGGFVVQSTVSCAPCPHHGPCSQATHRCAESIRPDWVARLMASRLEGDVRRAGAPPAEVALYRTVRGRLGAWEAVPSLAAWTEAETIGLIERAAWRLHLAADSGCGATATEPVARAIADAVLSDPGAPPLASWAATLRLIDGGLERVGAAMGALRDAVRAALEPGAMPGQAAACADRLRRAAEPWLADPCTRSYGRECLLSLEEVTGSDAQQASGLDAVLAAVDRRRRVGRDLVAALRELS